MGNTSKRAFIGSTAAAAGVYTLGNITGCGEPSPDKPTGSRIPKNASYAHPLDGIERENITITDVRVTLLSHELKPEEYWATANYGCGKTRTICRNTVKPSRNI